MTLPAGTRWTYLIPLELCVSEPSAPSEVDASAYSFPGCLKYDVVSGFLVFLIALPLCLGIAAASGYPPIGGVITAIVGGLVASLISNSELTIKGPAAGLIAIVAGCVGEMQQFDDAASFPGYRMALAVGVGAAALQIVFGLLKAGKLGDFFPTAAVHGLLASIGVIIMLSQFQRMVGVTDKLPFEPLDLIMHYGEHIAHFNLPIAIVGLTSLAIMVVYPMIKVKALKAVPPQLIVLIVAIPLAMSLNLTRFTPEEKAAAKEKAEAAKKLPKPAAKEEKKEGSEYVPAPPEPIDPNHKLEMAGKEWPMNPGKLLINVPDQFFKEALVTPNFKAYGHWQGWKWMFMFAIIASLESLLSAKAVDLLDPAKRKTNLNRDLFGCGVANLISSGIGGLPMISEIVRSRANVDNGAKTRLSNLSHGIFLLLFATMLPFVLQMIPIAALAAMLVFTGFRLAHPREFIHMYKIGIEQFIVFVTTVIAIICTDLLKGALIGMAMELLINILNGLPITSIFSSSPDVRQQNENTFLIVPHKAAVFSNWLGLRAKIEEYGLKQKKNLVIDLSDTRLVDHTVMEKLHEMERDFHNNNLKLEVVGLDKHRPVSPHPAAARRLEYQ